MTSNFSRNLIGGDIGGLAALASRLNGYPAKIEDVVHVLDHHVEGLVHDAGWWGPAADGFKHRWEVDADGAHALGDLLKFVGAVIGSLAAGLRKIDSALEQAAGDAQAAGVPVGQDGRPPVLPTGAGATVQAAAATYADEWQVAQDMAIRARMDANQRLMEVDNLIAPPASGNGGGQLSPDQWETDAEYLMGYWAAPDKARKYLQLRLPQLRAERDAARIRFSQTVKQYSKLHLKTPEDVKADRRASAQALQDANAELDQLEKKMPLAKVLDVRVGSAVVKLAPGLASDSKMFKVVADLPVLDVVFVVAATAIQSVDDNQKGQDWTSAVPENLAANVGGLAAGVLVGAAIVGGVALLGISAPAIAVGALAVGIGGIVAIGAGDAISEGFHEHWDEDIHKYGLVGGIGAGLSDVGGKTLNDMGDLYKKTTNTVGGALSGLWHGVFGP